MYQIYMLYDYIVYGNIFNLCVYNGRKYVAVIWKKRREKYFLSV